MDKIINNLIITLGTRDLQIKYSILEDPNFQISEVEKLISIKIPSGEELKAFKNELGTLSIAKARNGGEIIFDNFAIFKSHLTFPILEATIQQLEQKPDVKEFHLISLVVTDQNPINEHHYKNDTIFFGRILEAHFDELYNNKFNTEPVIELLVVKENLTDLEFQYKFWKKDFAQISGSSEPMSTRKIFLLPQGGIDQVNTALLLRIIETHPDAEYLQKQSELSNQISIKKFPKQYRKNLDNYRLKALIERFDFDGIIEIAGVKSELGKLATLGICIRSGNIDLLKSHIAKDHSKDGELTKFLEFFKGEDSFRRAQLQVIVNTLISYEKKDIFEITIRLNTLSEILYFHLFEVFTGYEFNREKFCRNEQKIDFQILKQKYPAHTHIGKYLHETIVDNKGKKHQTVLFHHKLIKDICNAASTNNEILDKINTFYENINNSIRTTRNLFLHQGAPVSIELFFEELNENGLSQNDVLSFLELLLEFEDINTDILKLPSIFKEKQLKVLQ